MLHAIIATGNQHKFRELKTLLAMPGIRWHSLAEFPRVPEVNETGKTFDENAVHKAQTVADATGHLALADDSGLEVEALNGAPGVRSARFAGRHGDDQANNATLLQRLEGVPPARRRARYRCSLALADPSGPIALTSGSWSGRIAAAAKGAGGFGYDPIFLLPRLGKTVGELPSTLKGRLSHRVHAARRMRPFLKSLVRQSRQPR